MSRIEQDSSTQERKDMRAVTLGHTSTRRRNLTPQSLVASPSFLIDRGLSAGKPEVRSCRSAGRRKADNETFVLALAILSSCQDHTDPRSGVHVMSLPPPLCTAISHSRCLRV